MCVCVFVCEWAENRQTRFYGCQLGAAHRIESISSPRLCLFVWIFATARRIKRSEKREGYLAHRVHREVVMETPWSQVSSFGV